MVRLDCSTPCSLHWGSLSCFLIWVSIYHCSILKVRVTCVIKETRVCLVFSLTPASDLLLFFCQKLHCLVTTLLNCEGWPTGYNGSSCTPRHSIVLPPSLGSLSALEQAQVHLVSTKLILYFSSDPVPFVEMWLNLESVICSEMSQKEKNKYSILMQIHGA